MYQEICQINVIHAERIAQARQNVPDRRQIARLATTLKLLGDPTRLTILLALQTCELCVCDLAALVATTPSAISHQLRLLRTAGLVHARKEGKIVYYRLEENSVQSLLASGVRHLKEERP